MLTCLRRVAAASLVVACAIAPAVAFAQAAPRASLLTTVTSEGVRDDFGGAVDRLLRSRLDELGVVSVQGSVALDIEEVQLALGCAGETPECLAQVAQQLEVAVLLLPNLDRAGDELVISVARFDLESRQLRRVSRRGAGAGAETQVLDEIDGIVRELFDLPPPAEPIATVETPSAVEAPTETEAPPPPPAEPALAGPLVLMGVGAAGLIVGAVTGALFLGEADAYAQPVTSPDDVAARDASRYSAETLALATNVLFIAGGAIAAAGVAWLIVELVGASERSDVALVPVVGPNELGLALVGGLE